MTVESVVHAVDDDLGFLAALERTLQGAGFAVQAHTSSVQFVEQLDPDRPGCVVSDVRMPDMDGLCLQQKLRERGAHIPIVFITGHGDAASAVEALKGGAVDFLEKPFGEHALLASVEEALAKDAERRRRAERERKAKARFDRLTPREKEIFRFIAADDSNREIAHRLNISPRTVEHHRAHLMEKMNIGSRGEILVMGVLCGVRESPL